MAVGGAPEKIPMFVVPCAVGFFCLSIIIGLFLAGPLHLSQGPFLLRFSALFTWASTFGLALYLGHRQPDKQPKPAGADKTAFL